MITTTPLLIVGASARAAAFSAARAGFAPLAVDLFADADLASRCPVRRVERYPHDLPKLLAELPDAPWMYTGALENHPEIVDRMAAIRPLWGAGGDVLRRVRDPFAVHYVLRAHGLGSPEIAPTSEGLPTDGTWLRKKLRSAGGLGIERWRGAPEQARSAGHFFQRYVPGVSCAAIYVGQGGEALLLGVSQQLLGPAWTEGSEFRYVGSIGPLPLSGAIREQQTFEWIGDVLAWEFGLVGLFGVDAVLAEDQVLVVEVNPRYTASMEVLERALGIRSIELHAMASRGELELERLATATEPTEGLAPHRVAGKAIVYARREVLIPAAFTRYVDQENQGSRSANGGWPSIADVPHAGSLISAGRPITTVLASGESLPAVEKELRGRIAEVNKVMGLG